MTPLKWQRLRQSVQILAFLLFFLLFVLSYQDPNRTWSTLFQRLDPLVMLAASLAGRTLLAGVWLALLTVGLTLLFGRAWCGWVCPLGTMLDWLKPGRAAEQSKQRGGRRRRSPPESWRSLKYVLLLTILVAALLGNQSLIFLDPLTLLTRTLAASLWPALSHGVYGVEAFLYQFDSLWGPLDLIHKGLIYPIFEDLRPLFIQAVPILLLFGAIIALNWWAERFWCRYLCPLGGLLGLLSKLAWVRRQVGPTCQNCALCLPTCPTATIDPYNDYRSDPAECTLCFDCLVGCPEQGVTIVPQARWRPAPWRAYDPGRREALTALGAAVLGVSLAAVEPISNHQPATLLRPPGATLTDFEARCIRCGVCLRVCPTQGLQPSLLEGGWQNVFTPQLVPRLGYCLFDCHACGDACPTGAIPILSLDEKHNTPIGLARVDRNRCLPWTYDTPCIVCEEMCPVADKAIRLEEAEVVTAQGEALTLQRPTVVKDLCIGCGICEYKCPLGGEAGIRVYTPTETDHFLL